MATHRSRRAANDRRARRPHDLGEQPVALVGRRLGGLAHLRPRPETHAIVLAGGYATRLWPITRDRPKMLLPIGETTVIGTVLEAIESDDRIDDVYVSTNEKFESSFESYLAESRFEKPQLSVEETTSESEKLGVVGALAQLIEREDVDSDTLIIGGDNLISFDVSEFLDAFEASGDPTLAAYDVGSYERASSYGLVELDSDDVVVGFEEKPDEPESTLASIACYAIPGEMLSLFDQYLDGDNNPDEPGWFIQWLQGRETVRAFTFEDAWFDIGTPESYLDAVAWYLDGESYVAPSANLDGATIGENVQVLDGVELSDTVIENSVVFPDAEITACEIRKSIIDRDTQIEGVNLSNAQIGAHTQLGY